MTPSTLSIFEMMAHAGVVVKLVMLCLLIFSVASWAIVLTKWIMFHRARNAYRRVGFDKKAAQTL